MYVYILLLFSCFLFWSKFYTRRNCGLLFSKNSQTLSPLVSFRLEKEEERKKERTVTDPVFFVLDYEQNIENIPLICFIEFFCFPMSVYLSGLFP